MKKPLVENEFKPPLVWEENWKNLVGHCPVQTLWLEAPLEGSGTSRIKNSEIFNHLSEDQKALCQSFGSERRREQWARARFLEARLRERLSQGGAGRDSVLTSVSHSQNAALAVGAVPLEGSESSMILGVGVDLEQRNRRVSEGIGRRLVDPSERPFVAMGLEALDFWVMKEACFKANPRNSGTVLSQYRLLQWDAARGTGEVGLVVRGQLVLGQRIFFQISVENGWKAAFAVCRAV